MDLLNHFLIAMPTLADPNFSRTVTYVCAHSEAGAMGIVINRPLELRLGEMLGHLDIEISDQQVEQMQVLQGGPVQRERGFVLHSPPGDWEAVLEVAQGIAVATSRDILEALATGEGPERSAVALGYAGWGAGQLEQELAANAWLSGPADRAIIFDLPFKERWDAAAGLLGVDLDLLTSEAGHA